MIKKNLKTLIISSIVILLPILAGVILWDKLPQEMPIHWNLEGEVDGVCSKSFAVLLMPLIMLAFHLVCFFITSADPKKQNHSPKMMTLVLWIVPAINTVITATTYATVMGKGTSVNVIICVFMGLLFVIIGNYLPKCKQNYTMGIKLPWTLNSEENWNKTHRMAGRLWVIGGVVITFTGFFGFLWLTFPVAITMALLPVAYSYVLHCRNKEKE